MPFIEPSSDIWKSILIRKSYDFYHLPEYAELEAEICGGFALGWVPSDVSISNEVLIPLVARWIPESDELYDLISPYGYPGILCDYMPVEKLSKLLEEFNREATQAGYVSTFIRLNPFLNNWDLHLSEATAEHLLQDNRNMPSIRHSVLGQTVSLDLSGFKLNANTEQEDYILPFSNNHRRNLRKLHLSGYRTIINDTGYIQDFIDAYYQTMHRRNARSYYFFPEHYFRKFIDITGEKLVFVSVVSAEGQFESGGLFTIYNGIMQYHLGATVDDAVVASPSKLMMEAAIREGISRNANVFHFGGGLGAVNQDGVYRFKQGFARDRHNFACLQFIHNTENYRRLLSGSDKLRHNSHLIFEPQSGYKSNNNFFPKYRQAND